MAKGLTKKYSIALAGILFGFDAFASDLVETHLKEVTVTTATKSEKLSDETPASVAVITAEEIDKSGADTLKEILEKTAGVYVSPSGGNAVIRGFAHSDIVYMIDGRRIKGEFSNSYELERIPAGMIEKIEIVKGASSVLYGSDALGGVINIVTKRPKEGLTGGIEVGGGVNKDGKGGKGSFDMFVIGGNGKTDYSFYANTFSRSAYSESENANIKVMQGGVQKSPSVLTGGAPFSTLKANLTNSYAVDIDYRDKAEVYTLGGTLKQALWENTTLRLELNYMKEDRQNNYISSNYPTAYTSGGNKIMSVNVPARQEDDNERVDIAAVLESKLAEGLDLKYQIDYAKYEKDRNVYAPLYAQLGYASEKASLNSPNQSTLEQLNNELMFTYRPNQNHTAIIGAEHRVNSTESTAYSKDDRTYKSIFAQHDWKMTDAVNVVYGARYDSDSIGESKVSLQAGGVYKINNAAKLRANYAQGFKSPDDRNLYVDQTNPQGIAMLGSEVVKGIKTSSETLKPEKSETIEAGLLGKGSFWRYDIGGFLTNVKDRIEQVTVGSGPTRYNTFKNISKSEVKGFEGGVGIAILDSFWSDLSYTALDAKNKTDDTKLVGIPDSIASVSVSYEPSSNVYAKATLKYIGKQYMDSTTEANAYTVCSVSGSYKLNQKTEFFAGIDNLFDASVDTSLGSNPGIYFYGGARYKF